MDYGVLSVTMLFCASLPECYVVPDLAAVLHATGQLEDRAEHRIRTTGAMIFPVMMKGGLTSPDGSGIAQILKVRLIHATVRNLILRGSPEAQASGLRAARSRLIHPADSMARALHVHGWDLERCTLPNNQDELAYTLLTFSYVFLRGNAPLGIRSRRERRGRLPACMERGRVFPRHPPRADGGHHGRGGGALRAHAGARPRRPGEDAKRRGSTRPHLGGALMGAMETVIPPGPFKAFPTLLTRRLIGPTSSTRPRPRRPRLVDLAKTLFALMMAAALGSRCGGAPRVSGFLDLAAHHARDRLSAHVRAAHEPDARALGAGAAAPRHPRAHRQLGPGPEGFAAG